jgi:hypothetical protein
MKIDNYKLVSEIITGNPNVDMLVIKPYLYIYIENDKIDALKDNGLQANDENIIHAYFTRLPESEYRDYLKNHTPVKISIGKLTKIKDQTVILKPVNFKYPKESLDEEDVHKIIEKGSKKLMDMMRKQATIERLPHVSIFLSDGILPAFALKALNLEVK